MNRLLKGREHRHEELREGITMSLYINLSLLAVLLVIPVNQGQTRIQMVVFVLMTTLALLVAHQIAFRLSSRFMNDGVVHREVPRLLTAQGLGAATAAALAVVPIIFFGREGIWLSESLLLAFVCAIGFIASRSGGATVLRATGYVGFLIVLVTSLIIFKHYAGA